jgi:hypothetical protein
LIYISLVLDVHPEQLCTATIHLTAYPSVIQVNGLQAGWLRKLDLISQQGQEIFIFTKVFTPALELT